MISCLLPRSFIRGSMLVVKLLYEATFASGEAMPTWASYILRLVGFFGRGWVCYGENRSCMWHENNKRQHICLRIQQDLWVIVKILCGFIRSLHQYLTMQADVSAYIRKSMTHHSSVLHNWKGICFIHRTSLVMATQQALGTNHFLCIIKPLVNKANILPVRGHP